MTHTISTALIVDDGMTGVGLAVLLAQAGVRCHIRTEDTGSAERSLAACGKLMSGPSAEVSAAVDVPTEFPTAEVCLASDWRGLQPDESRLNISLSGAKVGAVHMSFAAPVYSNPIVEVAKAGMTPDVQAQVSTLIARLGKRMILSDADPDFPGQVLADAYQWAADVLLTYHTTPWELDEAMEAAGFAQGPCLRQDAEGLDVAYLRRAARRDEPAFLQVPSVDRALEEGRLGRKGSWGWYRYPGGGGPVIDPLVEDLLEEEAWLRRLERSDLSMSDLVHRMRLALFNAARRLRKRGVADEDLSLLAHHLFGHPDGSDGLIEAMDALGEAELNRQLAEVTGPLIDPWTVG